MNKIIYILLFIAVLSQSACIKSSVIGGDILKNDEILVEFTDTSTLKARTVLNDSFKVYPNLLSSYLLGEFYDNNFGYSQSSLYCNFSLAGSLPEKNITDIDSIVLTMVVDTALIYGDNASIHNIAVYELAESIDKDSIFSNETFQLNDVKIGEKQILPMTDSVVVIEPKNDTVTYKDQVRILLDKTWGSKFLSDTNYLKNDTLFKENILKGLYIESTTNNSSIVGVKKRTKDNKYKTRIDVYYTINDTLKKKTFNYDKIVSHFKKDYSSSKVIEFLDDFDKGDSLLFVQGTDGLKVELDIPYLDFLKGKNINKAELILYTIEDSGIKVKTPNRLVTKYLTEDGDINYIEDYVFPENSRNIDKNIYFGYKTKSKEQGKELNKYIINLTMHLKKLLRDDIYSTKLFIYPEFRINDPGFAVLRGVNRSDIKSKLKITYSNID